jgi:hypothetical protein
MIAVENRSPFATELLSLLDSRGREIHVLVMVATFTCDESGCPVLFSSQAPVCFADEHRGDPTTTSMLREADACAPKTFVDVIVNGFAYAPRGGETKATVVELHVGDVHKQLRVFGDRRREAGIGLPGEMPSPIPFHKMPIIYERAFGGSSYGGDTLDAVCATNPVGIGFRDAPPLDPSIDTDFPNIEHSNQDSGMAAGYGIVGRGWSPRLQLAGTYDDSWLKQQWPLAPADFDPRHNQCAPQDQQSKTIQGGEDASLVNMTADGLWQFRLPKLSAPVYVIRDSGPDEMQTRLDTLYILPDTRRLVLCHRGTVPLSQGAPPREIVIGHMATGWLSARCKRKHYVDSTGHDGEHPDRAYFS